MLGDIKPGSTVRVTVTLAPTNEAAAKTLSRIFAKDPVNRQARRARKQLTQKKTEQRRRGGRFWAVRPKTPRLVQPIRGTTCTLLATLDVVNDLHSVERFIEVGPAS